ncbi:MAG TPA: S41 family peptidase [candidate division Zixibacteria bacterium]|nr:S41 family peptidase [candidate division Zixibacteria bacterium]MDD4917386.1 S41 family peptidase [candidate division Zixibacteria bacterium]MDM7972384.1 S41 family peptidase [candidate division Zixibacteria bacterium]HOD66188.1 S41 family peptidase [candidate division Zixibacteria bacterium]HPM36684.1 S41 family peptidase [candidate division Zixibacteria bacterium]
MMPSAAPDRVDLLISMVVIVLLVALAGGMGVYVVSDPGLRAAAPLVRAAEVIRSRWVEPVDGARLTEAGRRAMFDLLDRYSGYVDRTDFDRMREELSGAYGGIGVTIVPHDGGLLIMSVREDGPAGRVGLLTGDILVGTDSVPFARLTPAEASALLRGRPGTDVRVRVYRPVAGDTITVALTRQRIPLVHVPFAGLTDRNIIYIRVLDFDAGAADDIRAAVDSLLERAENRPAGLILDLRNNPGGLFSEGYRTANIFLKPGAFIVGTDARSRWNEEVHRAMYRDVTDGLPMAVLVNRGSASSAEIVAGAFQQAGRAVLVGDTTFGKGLVQGFISFPDGDGLRLTMSRYYFDNGVYLNRLDGSLADSGTGLVPDYYYAYPELDPFVQKLENSLLLQEFAYAHLEELAAEDDLDPAGPLLSAFGRFAAARGFAFTSATTAAARELLRRTEEEAAAPPAGKAAAEALRLAEQQDRALVFSYAGYIAQRLRQIAWERAHGAARTYREVILRSRGDIRLAEEILLARRS